MPAWLTSLIPGASVLSAAKTVLIVLAIAAWAGLLWYVRHETKLADEATANLKTEISAANQNADEAKRIKADAEKSIAAIAAELDAEKARAAQIVTVTRIIHDAKPIKSPGCPGDDDPIPVGGPGDAAYRCLLNPGNCASGPGGAG